MILRVSMIGMELAKGMLREIDYSSFVIKRSCKNMVCKEGTEKIAYNMGGNKAEIDFVLIGKSNKKYLKEVKAIPWEL